MVAVGGFTSVWGVLFGVAFITLVGEILKPLGAYDVVANGALLVLVVIAFPQGLPHGLRRGLARLRVPRLRRPEKGLRPVSTVPSAPALLAAEGLSMRFGGLHALSEVSFTIASGE